MENMIKRKWRVSDWPRDDGRTVIETSVNAIKILTIENMHRRDVNRVKALIVSAPDLLEEIKLLQEWAEKNRILLKSSHGSIKELKSIIDEMQSIIKGIPQ